MHFLSPKSLFLLHSLPILALASSSSPVYYPPESLTPAGVAKTSLTVQAVHGTGADTAKITKTLVVPHNPYGGDDTPGLISAVNNATGGYTKNAKILFQSGVVYNIWSPVVLTGLDNVEIAIEGNITLPTNISLVQSYVASSNFSGWWFQFKGNAVTLRGSLEPTTGWINSTGTRWWDIQLQTSRPHLINFAVTNSVLRNMKIVDSIGWNFALSNASNVHAYGNLIDCRKRYNGGFPFNTDGFAAGGNDNNRDQVGTDLLIEHNVVMNGDDCITVGSGASNVHFRNNYCQGGHGLSVGSLGKGGLVASVHNVVIENVMMVNELYGARFKSWTGGNGLAQNVTWRNIHIVNVPFPIYITQNYWDQGLGPRPPATSSNNTHIDNLHFENFYGIMEDVPYIEGTCISNPCWYYVPSATGKEVIIFDLYPGTATNVDTKDIKIITETGANVAVMCNSTAISNNPGFKCWDGVYIPQKITHS